MERKDFFKRAYLYGICSCAGLSLLNTSKVLAINELGRNNEPDWRIAFIQARFAKLIDILNSSVDESTKLKILENLGRVCSKQSIEQNKKYIGKVDEFLKNIEGDWAEKASFDKEKKEIKIIGKKTDQCFCPFVDKTKMTEDFCNCSLGWQKETFKTLLGEEVVAYVDSSILTGGDSYNFTIKVV